jgi:hypothetical protein
VGSSSIFGFCLNNVIIQVRLQNNNCKNRTIFSDGTSIYQAWSLIILKIKLFKPGVDYYGIDYSGIVYSGIGYSGIGYSGIGYSGIGYSGIGYSGIGYSGIGYSGIGYSGIG